MWQLSFVFNLKQTLNTRKRNSPASYVQISISHSILNQTTWSKAQIKDQALSYIVILIESWIINYTERNQSKKINKTRIYKKFRSSDHDQDLKSSQAKLRTSSMNIHKHNHKLIIRFKALHHEIRRFEDLPQKCEIWTPRILCSSFKRLP